MQNLCKIAGAEKESQALIRNSVEKERDREVPRRRLPKSLVPGKEIKKNKGRKTKKQVMENNITGVQQQDWADFVRNMISKEDIRAFNNDLRNK